MAPGQTPQLCAPTLALAARISVTDNSQMGQLLCPKIPGRLQRT